jgi:hypothetical protein
MKLTTPTLLVALLGALAPTLQADIVWTGAVSNDIFDEANWDFSGSTVTVVDPNVSINDNVLIANTVQPVEIPNLGGQIRFQIGDGFTLTLDNGVIVELGNDGVGGASGTTNGPKFVVTNHSKVSSYFITNRTDLSIESGCKATLGGGATPINGSTVDLTSGALLAFTNETIADYVAEHLHKTTVDGAPAVVDGNIQVVSDGGTGCIVTVIPQFPVYCLGSIGTCPCGNGNDGSLGSAGCANSISTGGVALSAGGSNSITQADLVLTGAGLVPGKLAVFFQGELNLNNGTGILFGDGMRCAGGILQRLETIVVPGAGSSGTTINIALKGGVAAGQTHSYQLWYSDNQSSPCNTGFNVSNSLEVSWVL